MANLSMLQLGERINPDHELRFERIDGALSAIEDKVEKLLGGYEVPLPRANPKSPTAHPAPPHPKPHTLPTHPPPALTLPALHPPSLCARSTATW